MQTAELKVAVLSAGAAVHSIGTTLGADLVLVGTHPTSRLTAFQTIHRMKAHAGRIYRGHGDWNDFPDVKVTSFDPVEQAFHIDYSIYTDSIGIFLKFASNSVPVPANASEPCAHERFKPKDPALR